MSRTDTAEIAIAAPPSAIYAALMDASQLVQWLPPDGMTGEISAFEPHTGGAFRITLRYPEAGIGKSTDDSDVVEATFGELVPDDRVEWLCRFDSPDPAFAGLMRMLWQLEPVTGGTRVRIVASDVPSGISAEDHAEGLGASLSQLKRFVEIQRP